MSEIVRGRDCCMFVKGDTITVTVSTAMVTAGWPGGQGVMWAPSTNDEFIVTFSDGPYGGFLLWGSNESSDQFTAQTGQFTYYRYGVMCFGGSVISTSSYEKYTYASRIGGGALVALVYAPNDKLRFSLRGLWTNEDEWTISADPRGTNDFIVGTVVQIPKASNNNFLTIQTML